MHAPPPPSLNTAITLTLLSTPEGVLMRADGDLGADSGPASVARTLCRLTVGLFEGAQPVHLGPEIVQAAL